MTCLVERHYEDCGVGTIVPSNLWLAHRHVTEDAYFFLCQAVVTVSGVGWDSLVRIGKHDAVIIHYSGMGY